MALEQPRELCGLHTITASESSNSFLVLPYGATLPSIFARVQYASASLASGSGTLTFAAKISYDHGATWTTAATGASITLGSTAQNGEQTLQVIPQSLPPDSGVVHIMVLATFGGSPSSPTVAYRVDLV